MNKENRLFAALYNEDAFQGISVPLEMSHIIEGMKNDLSDVIDE
jgi:hypothetical protein